MPSIIDTSTQYPGSFRGLHCPIWHIDADVASIDVVFMLTDDIKTSGVMAADKVTMAHKATPDRERESEHVTSEQSEPALDRPAWYDVILFNDDFTPMDFVVEVLVSFFAMDHEKAAQTMMTVHTQGKAVCGRYPYDIADTKALVVTEFAREHEYPLLCDIERAE